MPCETQGLCSTSIRLRRGFSVLLLLILASWVLFTNLNHQAEQDIYNSRHKPLGENLWSGIGYRYSPEESIATYPIWGYPLIVGFIKSDTALVILQISLTTISCLFFFNDILGHTKFLFITPLITPILMHASVKWPDAWYILAIMWLLFALTHDVWWIALLAGAVAITMRPDFLFLISFSLGISILLPKLRRILLLAFIGAFISLIPWILITRSITSTNGGLVAYISLGQLPNNPWEREYSDSAGFNFVKQFDIETPVSKLGNRRLMQATLSDIREFPGAYLKKMLFNFGSALQGGVYIGEFVPALSLVNSSLFLILITAFIFLTINQLLYGKVGKDIIFTWLILVFTLFWISLLQYINRHMNLAYAVLLLVTTKYIFSSESGARMSHILRRRITSWIRRDHLDKMEISQWLSNHEQCLLKKINTL